MADDSSVEYELNECEILDESDTQNVEQIYVIANDDDGNVPLDERILKKCFHLYFISLPLTLWVTDEFFLEHDPTEDETNASTTVRCDICDREFDGIQERNEHIEEHFKQIECQSCSRTFVGDRAYAFHTSTGKCKNAKGQSGLFRCSLCNEKVFDSKEALDVHMRDVHKCSYIGERLKCEQCDVTFGKVKYLRKHIREVHEMATPFHCSVCGKKFNRKANLIEHELIHDGKYLADCQTCGKSYRTASALKLHERTHTGEKPYACELCDKTYAYNTDLKRHKRSAHGILGTPYPCTMCSKTFYEPKLLRKHAERVHMKIENSS